MTQAHPSLAEQITAVEYAAQHFAKARAELQERGVPDFIINTDVMPFEARLNAAAETLKTLEFAREALN